MKELLAKKKSFVIPILFLSVVLISFEAHAVAEPSIKNYNDTLLVGVVGDTGVG